MSPKHVASCSFGKDSIATILLALEHGEPLDEAVYCEVMFDDAMMQPASKSPTCTQILPESGWNRN